MNLKSLFIITLFFWAILFSMAFFNQTNAATLFFNQTGRLQTDNHRHYQTDANSAGTNHAIQPLVSSWGPRRAGWGRTLNYELNRRPFDC